MSDNPYLKGIAKDKDIPLFGSCLIALIVLSVMCAILGAGALWLLFVSNC